MHGLIFVTKNKNTNRYWREEALSGLELFSATFRQHRFRRHSHPGYVVGVVTSGCESFFCRGKVHRAGPGEVILINPESQHDGQSATEYGWSYRVIYPREEHFTGIGGSTSPPRFASSVVNDPELARRIASLHLLLEQSANSHEKQLIWSEIILDLLERHAEEDMQKTRIVTDTNRIALIEEILIDRAVSGISLNELAKLVNWSPWYIVRAFKQAKGTSPYAFSVECRLRRAKKLMSDGESIASASTGAGFFDQSHFTRHFVRTYGFTPGNYLHSLNPYHKNVQDE